MINFFTNNDNYYLIHFFTYKKPFGQFKGWDLIILRGGFKELFEGIPVYLWRSPEFGCLRCIYTSQ